jgi:hypothetical protein
MRFPFIAATIVVLSLITCNDPKESASEMDPENTLSETMGVGALWKCAV